MRKKTFLSSLLFLISYSIVLSQESTESIQLYIEKYKDIAISEMKRTGVPASIKLAQGILETGAGTSDLMKRSNNHFGLKCKSWWTGEKVYHDDDKSGECFRKYASAEDSYIDHSDYLKAMTWYAFLFKLDPLDYKAWAEGLKKAGYATNPQYTQKLIKYIEENDLNKFSLMALGKWVDKDEVVLDAQKDYNEEISINKKVQKSDKIKSSNNGNTDVKDSYKSSPSYPETLFLINRTKVIYAKEGSSLLGIANQYKIPYLWLLDFNELRNGTDILQKDQLIFLQRKRKTGATEFHIMTDGENLYEISQNEGIKLESLLSFNYLTVNMLPVAGEKLYLQKPAAEKPRLR
ncbi:MAG: glycoside hydrolase family 73 protein [Chitinophagaceae bacterium]